MHGPACTGRTACDCIRRNAKLNATNLLMDVGFDSLFRSEDEVGVLQDTTPANNQQLIQLYGQFPDADRDVDGRFLLGGPRLTERKTRRCTVCDVSDQNPWITVRLFD